MPQIEVGKNIKGLREILCLAQSLADLTPLNVNITLYQRRIQGIIDELDKHRPLGSDGKHGNLHTETCGCQDKGHGDWCRHICCRDSMVSFFGGVCASCGHDYIRKEDVGRRELRTLPSEHSASCNHTACVNCWRSYLRERKCLLCGHDWADPELRGARR